jgi:hypothetical protein
VGIGFDRVQNAPSGFCLRQSQKHQKTSEATLMKVISKLTPTLKSRSELLELD